MPDVESDAAAPMGVNDPQPNAGPRLDATTPDPDRRRTLVFCTCYAENLATWERRYRNWLGAVRRNGVDFDQLLIVDDGSPVMPDWPEVTIVNEAESVPHDAPTIIFHFKARLGRGGIRDYPGWFRSFCFAAQFAAERGFSKVVHIELDAFVISSRFSHFINEVSEGWIGLQLPRHRMPESAIQIIAGRALGSYLAFSNCLYSEFRDKNIESCIPYTHILTQFKGDRYGQFLNYVPEDADWSVQISPQQKDNPEYFWWLANETGRKDAVGPDGGRRAFRRVGDPMTGLSGVAYATFVQRLVEHSGASSFFQIGPGLESETDKIKADLVWVSSRLGSATSISVERQRTFVYRMASDVFFARERLRDIFLLGIDVAFIDGEHLIEVVLSEFIATERACRRTSVIVLHDCLPLNERMAERAFRRDETEDAATRNFWTGDAWKIVPILRTYRPEIDITYVDCPPTGLVVCSNLNSSSQVLGDSQADILLAFGPMTLGEYGMSRLWALCPMLDSGHLMRHPEKMRDLFNVY